MVVGSELGQTATSMLTEWHACIHGGCDEKGSGSWER